MAGYIDFDTHLYEPISVWSDYIDPGFRDRSPEWVESPDGKMRVRIEDQIWPAVPGHRGYRALYGEGATVDVSGNDPTARLTYMDEHDTDVQLIFPTLGMSGFSGSVSDPELAGAYARAYNRYVGEFASTDPHRLRCAMLIPFNHPEVAAAELRRAHREHGLGVVFVNPTPPGEVPWSDTSRDVIWQAASELGVVVVFHEATTGAPSNAVGIHRYTTRYPFIYLCTHVIEAMLAITDVILGGTLERFPDLRIGAAEAHVSWIPGWINLLDQNYGVGTKIWQDDSGEFALSMSPSDYFRRQVVVSAFPEDVMIKEALEAVGETTVAASSDWPHPISAEHGSQGIRDIANRPELSDEQKQRVLYENAARVLA